MGVIDEILKQIERAQDRTHNQWSFQREKETLFLEFLEFSPAGGQGLHLEFRTENEKLEMHFEKRALCWLPYYLRDSKREIFLYEFVDARLPLRMDFDAGSYLIQRACFLELILRAQGFDRLDDDSLYHPLFRRAS